MWSFTIIANQSCMLITVTKYMLEGLDTRVTCFCYAVFIILNLAMRLVGWR